MRRMDALDAVLLPMHTVQQPDEPRVLGSAPDEPISHLMKKCPSQTQIDSTQALGAYEAASSGHINFITVYY